ncbi:MAG: DHH family phosphoesterase, partial [Patescibacteria group bacterium]
MVKRKWEIISNQKTNPSADDPKITTDKIIKLLLKNRGIISSKTIAEFLHPSDPYSLTAKDVGISLRDLKNALSRIQKAILNKESIVVYADYDADGITAGAIMWENLYRLGAKVMPYIPQRENEGYGFSKQGLDSVKSQYGPTLIISVDHGITAFEKIAYAKKLGIDVIVTDHHVKPKILPECIIVHTTKLCGAGISWFVIKELLGSRLIDDEEQKKELLSLATIGTIADMVPLTGPNRSIVKHGLNAIKHTKRLGLQALIKNAGVEMEKLGTYEVSHLLAPRLNAMGRLVHAMDALRLLCTKQSSKAEELAA